MLLLDHARFGRPAVLTTAVAKNFCWWSDGPTRAAQCGLQRTWGWLKEAAKTMDVPLVSFMHGVAPSVNYVPPVWAMEEKEEGGGGEGARTLPGLLLGNGSELHREEYPGLYERLDRVGKQLYADCGENQHFNEYGHRLLGHFLYGLFGEAVREGVAGKGGEEGGMEEGVVRGRLSPSALEVFERVSSGSTGHTLSCNLTLTQVGREGGRGGRGGRGWFVGACRVLVFYPITHSPHLPPSLLPSSPQGRALDLVPVSHFNFTLWTEKAEGSNNIFSGGKKKRSDRKQTWSPLSENATLDFDFVVPKGVRRREGGREGGREGWRVCLSNGRTTIRHTLSFFVPSTHPSLPPYLPLLSS